jgi:hypothetical protein
MACHNPRGWLLLPAKLHISSISAASPLPKDDIKLSRIKALRQTFVDLFDRELVFEHVDDS